MISYRAFWTGACWLWAMGAIIGWHFGAEPYVSAPATGYPTAVRVPASVQPTSGNGGTPAVDKTSLIIQQNPDCWTGVPGYVCDDDTQTYAWGGFAGPRGAGQ